MNRLFKAEGGYSIDEVRKQLHGAKYNFKRDGAIFLSTKKRGLEQSDKWVEDEVYKKNSSSAFWRGVKSRVDTKPIIKNMEVGSTSYILEGTEKKHLTIGVTPIFHRCDNDIFVWVPTLHKGEVVSSWFNIKDCEILSLFLVLYPRDMSDIVFIEDFQRSRVTKYITQKNTKIVNKLMDEVRINGFLRINEQMEHIVRKYIRIQENFDGNSIVFKALASYRH